MTLLDSSSPFPIKTALEWIKSHGCEGNCKYKYFYDRSLWCSSCLFEDESTQIEQLNEDNEGTVIRAEKAEDLLDGLEKDYDGLEKDYQELEDKLTEANNIIASIHEQTV